METHDGGTMIHLIYVSSATHEMSDNELGILLRQSRSRNQRQEITGMLLYVNGSFVQVLEGSKQDVNEVYSDILIDDRNTGNIVIANEAISDRLFPDWTMGFKKLTSSDANELPGYTDFIKNRYTPLELANKNKVIKLLYHFKETNF